MKNIHPSTAGNAQPGSHKVFITISIWKSIHNFQADQYLEKYSVFGKVFTTSTQAETKYSYFCTFFLYIVNGLKVKGCMLFDHFWFKERFRIKEII